MKVFLLVAMIIVIMAAPKLPIVQTMAAKFIPVVQGLVCEKKEDLPDFTWPQETSTSKLAVWNQKRGSGFTIASGIHKLGSILELTNVANNNKVTCRVTDKSYPSNPLELSREVYLALSSMRGVIAVEVEVIK